MILPDASTEMTEVSELDHVPPLSVCVSADELSKQISETPKIIGPDATQLEVVPDNANDCNVPSKLLVVESSNDVTPVLVPEGLPLLKL